MKNWKSIPKRKTFMHVVWNDGCQEFYSMDHYRELLRAYPGCITYARKTRKAVKLDFGYLVPKRYY